MNRLIRLLIKNSSHLCRGNVSTEEESKKKKHHTKNKKKQNTRKTQQKKQKKGTKTKQKQNKQDTKKPEGNVSARVSPESIVFFSRFFFFGGVVQLKRCFFFVVLMSFQINVKNVSRLCMTPLRLFMHFLHFARLPPPHHPVCFSNSWDMLG